ncbi:MAG: alpha-ketoacid dehydrogenase subunit beta [Candidatus Sericytochromatia bacterium]|nr:alpha-ketoacid dehydrogenase subunit beta [Candidatus Tanganyikabacteria bacterium]
MATYAQGIRLALHYAEENLGLTDVFGEDVGPPLGGVFTATQGIKCAWNSPLDERGIIGMAIGIALAGGRPVAEIQFADYIFNTIDMLKLAGNLRWSSYGNYGVPLVIMTPVGAGIHGSIYHSHSFESMATHIPGFKIVAPSNALDAYGLMLSSIVDPDPVMYLKSKALMRVKSEHLIPGEPGDLAELNKRINAPIGDRSKWVPDWPAVEDYRVPIGKASVVREGSDLTVITYSRHVLECARAADQLRGEGISCEVIDLRTLFPVDWPTLRRSVAKTGRVLVVNEDTEVTNYGEHLIRKLTEEFFFDLQVAPRLLAGVNVPGVGISIPLEEASVPQYRDVLDTMRDVATQPGRGTTGEWPLLPETVFGRR